MKRCVDCDLDKPLSAFYVLRQRGRRPVVYAACKSCHADRVKRSKARNPEKHAAAHREWMRDHVAEQNAQRRTDRYREGSNRHRRAQRAADPEPIRLADRRRRATRRARQRGAHVEHVDPAAVWERDAGVCGICGLPADPEDWHLDHVVPLACGGEHSPANTQVSHPHCNLMKGAQAA